MVVMSVLLEQAKGGHGAVQVGQDRDGPVAAGSRQVTPTTDRANISHPVDGSLTRQQVRAGRYQSQTRRKTPTASIPAALGPAGIVGRQQVATDYPCRPVVGKLIRSRRYLRG